MTTLNIDPQMVVQDKVNTTLTFDQVESKTNQDVNITNPLDATSGGNDHEVIKDFTSEKGGSRKPTTTKNNN
eukprot:CAMPEP_0196809014 /NCGR_PEP_ID=MMETSP1362-20130617/8981_1 /TAXON_ID=163516 /ORGANISM="Leptocylindrus danicus, Strain CCMP1856" /LENGTH=71 /DNA_ID=CAMNT_0042183555 /DNA_START=832 /DNA_END=1047 /DNA_ORIENTATION=-